MTRLAALPLFALLSACASAPVADHAAFAVPPASGDLVLDSALLLAASEAAPDAASRAPLLARLDAAGISAAKDATEDPLAGWRAEAAASGTAPVFRGRALGPAYRRARLSPGQTLQLEQVFLAGERAEIAAAANDADKLMLSVRDKSDNEVCAASFTPSAKCHWLPIYTERYEIELVNQGSHAASIYIVFK